jgi:hypothetical protein
MFNTLGEDKQHMMNEHLVGQKHKVKWGTPEYTSVCSFACRA